MKTNNKNKLFGGKYAILNFNKDIKIYKRSLLGKYEKILKNISVNALYDILYNKSDPCGRYCKSSDRKH